MYEDLRVRSKLFLGIDRDVFVKFSPIPVSQLKFIQKMFVVYIVVILFLFRVYGDIVYIIQLDTIQKIVT